MADRPLTSGNYSTLADAQRERDRMRLHQVQRVFDRAMAESIETSIVMQAIASAEQIIISRLDEIIGQFTEVISGENNETKIHYLLSDTAHDVLRRISEVIQGSSLPEVTDQIARGIKPRPLLSVSQWAEQNRILSTGTNSPGPWRNDKNPHLTEIMDALSEHSPVRKVTMVKGSQIGGTEIIYNWVGYIMDHVINKEVMLVTPDETLRDTVHNPRLRAMINETPALTDRLGKIKRRHSLDQIEFSPGVNLINAVASAPSRASGKALPFLIMDEVDLYKRDLGGEGSATDLFANRQATFSRSKTYQVSTPRGEMSAIIDEYEKSDQRQRHVPCPHCDHLHVLDFHEHFGFEKHEVPLREGTTQIIVTDAWFVCPSCGGKIEESHKTWMFERAQWIPRRPHITRHRGYALPSFYSPLGLGRTWKEIAQNWVEAQGRETKLKVFFNTILGEVFEQPGDRVQHQALFDRREDYLQRLQELPIALITAGIDVQKNRFEATIIGWGPAEERWVIAHEIIPAETHLEEEWAPLHDLLDRWDVDAYVIDYGYQSKRVKEFVAQSKRRGWAGKGSPSRATDEIPNKRAIARELRKRTIQGIRPVTLGTQKIKDSVIEDSLSITKPGPGYTHFPIAEDLDISYFEQLAAERKIQKVYRGRIEYVWDKIPGARNEAIDCLMLNYAAMLLMDRDLSKPRPIRFHINPDGDVVMESHKKTAAISAPAKPKSTSGQSTKAVGKSDWASRI